MAIQVPGNVYYNGYVATRELLRCVEEAGTTANIAVIKKLEGRKMTARDRMQAYDAWIDPATHQCQQTIYMATYNDQPKAKDDIFKILTQSEPKDVDGHGRAEELQARDVRGDADVRDAGQSRRVIAQPPSAPRQRVALGLLFALIALGFMLVVSLMETINLAHGSFFALGMYVALLLVAPTAARRRAAGRPIAALPLGVALRDGAAAGAVRRRRRRHGAGARAAPHLRPRSAVRLLLTFGAALVIEEAIRAVWGSTEKQLPLPEAISGAFMLGDLIYAKYRLFACALRGGGDRPAVAVPREDAVRLDHQGRRARQRDGARARHQSRAAAPRSCSRWASRSPAWPAS